MGVCQPKPIELGPRPAPAEYFVCADDPDAPATEDLRVFDVTFNGATVQVYLKSEVDARDEKVANWVVDWDLVAADCRSQLKRVEQFQNEQGD